MKKRAREEKDESDVLSLAWDLEHGSAEHVAIHLELFGAYETPPPLELEAYRAVRIAVSSPVEPIEKLALLERVPFFPPIKSIIIERNRTLLDHMCHHPRLWRLIPPILERGWGDAKRAIMDEDDHSVLISPIWAIMVHADLSNRLTQQHKELMDLMLSYGASWNTWVNQRQLFECACTQFSPMLIEYLLSLAGHVQVNTLNGHGRAWKITPLASVAASRHDYVDGPKLVRLLLNAGATPESLVGSSPPWSALQMAFYCGNAAVVEVLLPVMQKNLSVSRFQKQFKGLSIHSNHSRADHLKTWLLAEKMVPKLTEHDLQPATVESVTCFWSRLRLFGPLRSLWNHPTGAMDPLKCLWLTRECVGRVGNHKTVLHLVCETNNVAALRMLLKHNEANPFLRDGARQTARQVATSDEARRLVWAYEQWRPVRAIQHWWGPAFLQRAFALMRAIRYLEGVHVCSDVRKLLVAALAAHHAV